MATTVTQSELDAINEENAVAVSTQTPDTEQTYTGKFIGTLVGNATTAKELEAPYNFTLTGDATGTTKVNAKDVALKVTVNHATEADTADFAGKTNLAARATLADMANTAEFAYRAGRLSNLLIKLHGGVTGSGQLTNADTMDIAISGVDVSYFFVFSALPERNPDITKAYVDLSGHHFWIYDTANTVWKDAYDYLLKTLELHGQRLDVLEQSKTTNTADIETLKSTVSQHGAKLTNHEDRITVNERGISAHDARITTNATDISALDRRLTAAEQLNTSQSESLTDHERRIGNIETTTDVGQIAVRVQAIENKNTSQDTDIARNKTAIEAIENKLPTEYVTIGTPQTVTGLKHFTQFLGVKNTALDMSGMSVSAGNTVIAELDKNGIYVSGIGAGIYHSDDHDTSYLQLATTAKANDVDGVIIEVQKNHKDNTKIAYAPSILNHTNLAEIATTDYVENKATTLQSNIDSNKTLAQSTLDAYTQVLRNETAGVAQTLRNETSATAQSLQANIDTVKNNSVTLADAQTITGLKYFTQPPYTQNTGVDFVENQVAFGNAIAANLDKNGRYISGISSGMYVNSSDITDKTTILQIICAASTADGNGIIAEFQKTHKDQKKVAYAPSNITHNNLAEIATTDWVLQSNINTGPKFAYFKIGNDLLITVGYIYMNNGLETITFPYPYKSSPIVTATVIGLVPYTGINDFVTSIQNVTPTSFQASVMKNGVYDGAFTEFIIVGTPA